MSSAAAGVVRPDDDPIRLRKSSTAAPCFRNSGLLTTANGGVATCHRRVDQLRVPSGTVLLSTTTV